MEVSLEEQSVVVKEEVEDVGEQPSLNYRIIKKRDSLLTSGGGGGGCGGRTSRIIKGPCGTDGGFKNFTMIFCLYTIGAIICGFRINSGFGSK